LKAPERADYKLEDFAEFDPGSLASSASAIYKLAARQKAELEKLGYLKLWREIELPLTQALASMELLGVAIDHERLYELKAKYALEATTHEKLVFELTGEKFNIGSPKQLQEVLFDRMKLPKTRKNTTEAKALRKLASLTKHPAINHILSFRSALKRKTMATSLLSEITPDNRIHTTFNQLVTTTGRLSSSEPNLQNIPAREEEGRLIRDAFVAGPGYEGLMTADYSQIEMRIMASLSQDKALIDAFESGEDLHRAIASKVFGVALPDVTDDMRTNTKMVSYGLAYRLSAESLAERLNISVEGAEEITQQYFARFRGVRDYLNDVVVEARGKGYTETMLGRRRYLPDLSSRNNYLREAAERAAVNAPIQGTAADMMKAAIVKVYDALQTAMLKSRLLLTVHDEIITEIAPGEYEKVKKLTEREMSTVLRLAVPTPVSTGYGRSWLLAAH
jgi:DNA polymerase-1